VPRAKKFLGADRAAGTECGGNFGPEELGPDGVEATRLAKILGSEHVRVKGVEQGVPGILLWQIVYNWKPRCYIPMRGRVSRPAWSVDECSAFVQVQTRFTEGMEIALITLGSDRINSVERWSGITPWARAFFI
jgi:hypothetical protein